MLPDGLTLAQAHFSEDDPRVRGAPRQVHFPSYLVSTLALFALALEEEHVGVDGPLFHVLLDSLHQNIALTGSLTSTQTGRSRKHTTLEYPP